MGLRIFHGWPLMLDLNLTNLGEYGFDTVQIAQMNASSSQSRIRGNIQDIDNHFSDTPGIMLSFQYWADGGDPIACPNYDADASQVGIVDRDSWYNDADAPFYDNFENVVKGAHLANGSRLRGVRWNHEIGPERFKEDSLVKTPPSQP